MLLYEITCGELGDMNMFAPDRDVALHLFNVYLKFNFAEEVEFQVGDPVDRKQLDQVAGGFLKEAVARDKSGIGTLGKKGWKIVPVWEYPFPEQIGGIRQRFHI